MSEVEKGVYRGIDEEGKVLICDPPHSALKRWLGYYRDCRSWRRCGEVDLQPRSRQCLLLATFILLALALMVLLLLWNYKCIIIEKMCSGQGSSMFPLFGHGEESDMMQKPD